MHISQHQAQGLQRLFSKEAAPRLVSVLTTPNGPDSGEFVLALAGMLASGDWRTWLVETVAGNLSDRLGCHPLRPYQKDRSLDSQMVRTGDFGFLNALHCMAGDKAIADAAISCRSCDFIIFDGGRFSISEAPLEASTDQYVILLLGKSDAEAAYALMKALKKSDSPARILLLGEHACRLSQMAKKFLDDPVSVRNMGGGLCQKSNNLQETSSNTLSIVPNLGWVVSRITENDQPKVAHGGIGKSAKEVEQ